MENNVINESGFKLESPVEVTLPYTATRDCFVSLCAGKVSSQSYVYLYYNDLDLYSFCFVFNGNGWGDSKWFPLKKGDTISLRSANLTNYKLYVM